MLQPRSMGDSTRNGDEWAGRIKVIRQMVQKVDDKVDGCSTEKQMCEVEKRITAAVEKRMNENTAAVDKRIGEVNNRVGEVAEAVDRLHEVLLARLPQPQLSGDAAVPAGVSVVAVPKPESD